MQGTIRWAQGPKPVFFGLLPQYLILISLVQFLFIYLVVLGLRGCMGFSLAVVSRGYSLVVEHELSGSWACICWALEHRVSSCGAQT